MKHFVSSIVVFAVALSVCETAFSAPSRTGRVGVQQQNVMSSARMPSIPISTIGVTTSVTNVNPSTPQNETVKPDDETTKPIDKPDEPEKPDMREKEREACMRNNIGAGNTFVWASRYSDISNYATMIEDTEVPENNVCFVRVDIRSADPKIDLSDIPSKYFEMGNNIVCGSWVDEDKIEKRILAAKKNARTWATVGGAVGGAATGVGLMELFGNKLIGGAVQGQKAGSIKDQFKTYLAGLNATKRDEIISYFREINNSCKQWKSEYGTKPKECDGVDLDDKGTTKISYEEVLSEN